MILLSVGVWIAFPQWQDSIFDEDRIVEDLTVAFYLLALAIGLIAAIRLRGRYKALSLAVIPGIALLFALEELDWGFLVVYGTDSGDKPQIFGKFGIDLHDLPDAFSYAIAHGLLPPLDWIAAIVVFVALAVILARAALRWCRRDPLCSEAAIALLALTLALVSLAKVVDVHAVKDLLWSALGFDPTPVEETAELAASVVLFQAALRLRQMVTRKAPSRSPLAASLSSFVEPDRGGGSVAVRLAPAESTTALASEELAAGGSQWDRGTIR